MEQLELLSVQECKIIEPLWGKNWTSSQKLNINLPFSPTILFLRIYHQGLQPSGQIQQHPDWTRHICFCIVSGWLDNSGVEHLQQRLHSLLKPKIFIKTIHPFTEKSLPISVLEKRTSIDTKCRCSEELFIIIKTGTNPNVCPSTG